MGKTKSTIGAGVGLAAIAAGTYFLYGKHGTENRKRVKGWALRAKGEILEKLEGLKHINKDSYHRVIDQVARRYRSLKKVDRKELNRLVNEVKGFWQGITHQVPTNGLEAKKTVKKRRKTVAAKAKTRAKAVSHK
ncbi:MAG: YtxH domain-containing protein [Elusimicrobiota bacterium]